MNRLRVVLVNPPPLAVVEPWYDRPDWGRIALAYLAGWLRRKSLVEVFVVDAKLERLDFQQVQSRVAELAAERGTDPVSLMLDLCEKSDLEQFFVQPFAEAADETRFARPWSVDMEIP